jgi:hypothetical protein
MGIRSWLRRIERDAKETSGTFVLVDTESGEEIEVSKNAFLAVLSSSLDDEEEPDPEIAPLLERLDRLVDRDTGEPFWLYPTRTAANTEEE